MYHSGVVVKVSNASRAVTSLGMSYVAVATKLPRAALAEAARERAEGSAVRLEMAVSTKFSREEM